MGLPPNVIFQLSIILKFKGLYSVKNTLQDTTLIPESVRLFSIFDE